MKIKLIFDDWHNKHGGSEYNWDESLFNGIFHAGTSFDGTIEITDKQAETEFKEYLKQGYRPVFWIQKIEKSHSCICDNGKAACLECKICEVK